jgi:hypothetical protein
MNGLHCNIELNAPYIIVMSLPPHPINALAAPNGSARACRDGTWRGDGKKPQFPLDLRDDERWINFHDDQDDAQNTDGPGGKTTGKSAKVSPPGR